MSSRKILVLAVCVVVVVLGALQSRSSANLIAEWKLDDPGTPDIPYGATCADTLGLRNLTYQNLYNSTNTNLPQSTTGRWGVANTAVHFDGVYDGAYSYSTDINNLPAYNRTNFTIEGFFKKDDTLTAQRFFYAESSFGGPNLYLGVNNNHVTFGALGPDPSGWRGIEGTDAIVPDQWYYVAGVVQNDYLTLYVYDGTNMQTLATETRPISTRRTLTEYDVCIGTGLTRVNTWNWIGTLDNIRVYDTALDAVTLMAHATTPDVPEPSTLALLTSGSAGTAGLRLAEAEVEYHCWDGS